MEQINFLIEEDSANMRLDLYLSNKLDNKSRSYIQNLIEQGNVFVNKAIKKSSYKLVLQDEIQVTIPNPVALNINPEDIPLDILYEDKDVVVVNKPQGMVVHPAAGVYEGTLVNALISHCKDLSGINGVTRPGIVHRIDKDTSGVLVIAKNDYSHNKLAQQFKEHSMKRVYLALVEGIVKQDLGTVDAPLARHPKERIRIAVVEEGRRAVTHFNVIERYKNTTLIECSLETGRTHQIRVHMAHINHPVVGDPVYGYKKQRFKLEGQLLHAKLLGFIHPTSGEYMEFESKIPDYFENVLNILRKELNK
jgi:23S rRNA pseudouridine1911/1915/1917 synthase